MKKIEIETNIINVKEVFSGLTSEAGFPEGPDIKIDLTIDDTVENYQFLCSSPLIKSWKFKEERSKELAYTFIPENYEKLKKDLEEAEINMKDLRDIIMLSYSLFCVTKMKEGQTPQVQEVLDYFLVNKSKIKERVYDEEFILRTVKAISQATNPLLDFLERVKKNNGLLKRDDVTFGIYYKALYDDQE